MPVTESQIDAASRAEYDYFNRGRKAADGMFIPTPRPLVRVMLEAAERVREPERVDGVRPVVVTARRPGRR